MSDQPMVGVDRLVLLHGFTQTHAHWYQPARFLERPVALVDLPGHGAAARPTRFVDDARALGTITGPATYVGYSMGGRLALATAIEHPDSVRRLVLIGATAGIDDPDAAAKRRRLDAQRADDLERDGVPAFLDTWLANPMFATLTEPGRYWRLRNTAVGLAASLRRHGTGTQPSYWDRLGELACPLLYVVGERDEKFRAVGERLVERVANADLAVISDAGHACHSEQPARFADCLRRWLPTAPARC